MGAIVLIQVCRVAKAKTNRKECGAPWDSLASIKQELKDEKVACKHNKKCTMGIKD